MSRMMLAAQSAHFLSLKLPDPKAKYTVPIIVILAVLAGIALMRKLMAIALLAVVIAAGFLAYQAGAFNHWVDKGKQVIQQR